MKRIFGYCRVSGKSQLEGDGFPRQEEAIRNYAESHGLKIEKMHFDDITGTVEIRPSFNAIMEVAAPGDLILVESLNRLSRDLVIQEQIFARLQTQKIDLISVQEGEDLMNPEPARVLIRQVCGAVSQYQKSELVCKLAVARARIRNSGVKCDGRKNYQEALGTDYDAVMKEIKRLRRKQKGSYRIKSYTEIAKCLNAGEWKSASGKAFTGQMVQNMLR